MFEFLKPSSRKDEEESRQHDEERQRLFHQMKQRQQKITENLGRPELEATSHTISEMWSDNIAMTLSRPIFAGKDEKQITHDASIEKIISENGEALAEYLREKKKKLDEE